VKRQPFYQAAFEFTANETGCTIRSSNVAGAFIYNPVGTTNLEIRFVKEKGFNPQKD
jgi:hypothetical protein